MLMSQGNIVNFSLLALKKKKTIKTTTIHFSFPTDIQHHINEKSSVVVETREHTLDSSLKNAPQLHDTDAALR